MYKVTYRAHCNSDSSYGNETIVYSDLSVAEIENKLTAELAKTNMHPVVSNVVKLHGRVLYTAEPRKPTFSLDYIFNSIDKYQKDLGYDHSTYSEEDAKHGLYTAQQMQAVNDNVLAINQEVAEFLAWLPWKPWRAIPDQESNTHEASLELVDIMFFLVNLCLILKISASDFTKLFEFKLKENQDRIKRNYNNKKEDRIVT